MTHHGVELAEEVLVERLQPLLLGLLAAQARRLLLRLRALRRDLIVEHARGRFEVDALPLRPLEVNVGPSRRRLFVPFRLFHPVVC